MVVGAGAFMAGVVGLPLGPDDPWLGFDAYAEARLHGIGNASRQREQLRSRRHAVVHQYLSLIHI